MELVPTATGHMISPRLDNVLLVTRLGQDHFPIIMWRICDQIWCVYGEQGLIGVMFFFFFSAVVSIYQIHLVFFSEKKNIYSFNYVLNTHTYLYIYIDVYLYVYFWTKSSPSAGGEVDRSHGTHLLEVMDWTRQLQCVIYVPSTVFNRATCQDLIAP